VRAALIILLIPLVGCQQLLGIQDPSTGTGDDDGRTDGGGRTDGSTPPSGDHLEFSVPNFTIAMGQRIRFNVFVVHENGQKEDVTLTATVTSADTTVATQGPAEDTALAFDGVASGTSQLTATYSGAADASVLATVSSGTCHPVINEFQTAGTDAADEWVELYNPCNTPVLVANWMLGYRAANNVTPVTAADNPLITLAGTMNAEDVWLYAGPSYVDTNMLVKGSWGGATGQLGGTSGAIGLRSSDMTLVDSVAYGMITAGNVFQQGAMAAPPTTANVSDSRQPFDGANTDVNGTDFKATTTTTPGVFNY
jgi:hypothetical protein